MQLHSTRTASFPENLQDYAPWVSTHGLVAPYGECQCGCGGVTKLSQTTSMRNGDFRGHPRRFSLGHNMYVFERRPTEECFWENVDKRGPDECWPWTGITTKDGYGRFNLNYGRHGAHRISYELNKGPIPDGMLVCHECDNPICVNPKHLWLGTHNDNVQDAVAKNRVARGERAGIAKLNVTSVKEIRHLASSGMRLAAIAKMFSVAPSTILQIVRRRTWAHVEQAIANLPEP